MIIFIYPFKQQDYLLQSNGMFRLEVEVIDPHPKWLCPMLEHLREHHYHQGQRDRDAGLLPRMESSVYLEGYLKGRPQGLDEVMQYFPSVDAYMQWKYRHVS